MGINCSSAQDDSDSHVEKDTQTADQAPAKIVKTPRHDCPPRTMADQSHRPHNAPSAQHSDAQYDLVKAYDQVLTNRIASANSANLTKSKTRKSKSRLAFRDSKPNLPPDAIYDTTDAYQDARKQVQEREGTLNFDFMCRSRAPDHEKRADEILQLVKQKDIRDVYGPAEPRMGYGGQEHPRFFGDHFLSNADLIEQTELFKISRKMPKGAHLHIHFNANLLPNVLVDIAKDMPHMYIMSNVPLVTEDEGPSGFDRCKIQFSILSAERIETVHDGKQSLFETDYKPKRAMPFKQFCDEFQEHYNTAHGKEAGDREVTVDTWLRNKLVFQEEEAYNWLQTAEGAWEKFNGRTQMMKGLFNYKKAYSIYTKLCMEEFADDNIQYAEIRPNFMATNQVWLDDGSAQIDNEGIVQLIIEEYENFQRTHRNSILKGLKIIYCTPRSFEPEKVAASLAECLRFKKDYPGWIAGFDLVGEESKGNPLKDFVPQFLEFKKNCRAEGVDIPFLFHCGETLDIGTDTDGNLVDALLLGSKRIGHGFALSRHPYIMEQMKKRDICVEVCPISNEILGLTPRMNGHAVYSLLAHNVHCTVSTDNGTLFRSRLSHDFYQTMAGKSDMTLHGWRQLIEWSIEHSCMELEMKAEVYGAWEKMWEGFCRWIDKEYGDLLTATNDADGDAIMNEGGSARTP
ncbi:hypothetical protein B0H66DRAFT_604586 [Apodospora peruviana]|uniref:Adenosine deaminase domain-containing protein n=1 Tax=Apodospora peruviana TaxID=516989 RepID=A0AAE0I1B9_9PEZI|nr:hypothetical protein B0H66DRAFT_604586 [Apodospora peruviana]